MIRNQHKTISMPKDAWKIADQMAILAGLDRSKILVEALVAFGKTSQDKEVQKIAGTIHIW